MEDRTMWANQLKVRNACEECHKRKIKCIMPESGGACRACKSAARNCFFLPRQKCGRVPKKDIERRAQTSNNVEEPQNSAITFSTSDVSNEYFPMDTTGTASEYSAFGPGYLTPSMQVGEPGFYDENIDFPFADVSGERFLPLSNHGSRTSLSSSSNESNRMTLANSTTSLQNLDWQLNQVQAQSSDAFSEEQQKLFARLLHECHQMEKQNEALLQTGLDGPSSFSTKAVLQSTISSVDAICHAILEVAGNNNQEDAASRFMPDNKLMSVTMAATFAVFEICEALASKSMTTPRQCSDYTLMWKRLDLNLTQIRVSLSRLLQTNGPYLNVIRSAITRAKVLDNRIKSTVQDGYSDWEDGL